MLVGRARAKVLRFARMPAISDGGIQYRHVHKYLICRSCGCMRLLQQASGLRNQLRYFERFHQERHAVFLQKCALIPLLYAI